MGVLEEDCINANEGTFTDLQNMISNASSKSSISLQKDYLYNEGFDSGGIKINKSLTINGNGHKIDALGKSRIFYFENDQQVTLNNIVFCNGNAVDSGGAICGNYDDNVSVVNCTFINNSASYGHGGAIYYCYKVMDCYFANNTALGEYYNEVGIYYPGSGGAICYVDDVENCIFVNNHADDSGGAIDTCNCVVNCTFVNNNAYSFGGAIYGDIERCTYALNCRFLNNSACYGGAIEKCSAVNCDFIDNYVVNTNPTKEDGSIIRIYPLSSYLPIVSYPKPEGNVHFNYELPPDEVYTINSVMIVDCNIQENALNDYGFVKFVGGELILESLDSDNYTILASVSGKNYVPSYEVYKSGNYVRYYAHFNLSNLSAGNHEVNIYLCNSTYVSYVRAYYNSVVNATVQIDIKTKFDIFSSDVSKYYGGSEKYTVNLTKDDKALTNEFVQISVNGETSTVKTDSKGQASIDLDLPVGEYDVTSVYGAVSTTSKVIVKSTLTTNDGAGVYLNSKVSASFLNTTGKPLASKQVNFKINGEEYTATTDANGVATTNVDLDVGNYTVTAVNPANNEEKDFNLIISKSDSEIALISSQNNIGTTLTATLMPATATGNVIFTINGDNISAVIKNGKSTLTIDDLEAGSYVVTASYDGDNNLKASNSTITFTVTEETNTTEENSTDNETSENTTNTTVEPEIVVPPLDKPSADGSVTISLPSDATGKVTLSINGKSYNFVVENGVANVIIPNLGEGNYPYTITYSGDAKYSSFTNNGSLKVNKTSVTPETNSTVNPNDNKTNTTNNNNSQENTHVDNSKIIASNVNVVYSAGTYYTITVYGTDGKPANTVVKITGKISKTLTATNGVAKFKIDQVPGTYKITITALGKSVAKTITVKHLVTLKTVKVKKSAKKLVLQATLGKVNGKYLKNKKVTFKFNGKKYTAKTNKKGVAKVTIKLKVLKKLKVGKKVTYQATYLKDTVKKTVKVKK